MTTTQTTIVATGDKYLSTRRTTKKIYKSLCYACRGASQVPDEMVGMALAGHVVNGTGGWGVSPKKLEDLVEALATLIEERWVGLNPAIIRANVRKGYREVAAMHEEAAAKHKEAGFKVEG